MIKKILLSTVVAGGLFALAGLDNKLRLTHYNLSSEKVDKRINIVFLSDLHSMSYKDGGKQLFRLIDKAEPCCVILGGDTFDKHSTDEMMNSTYDLIKNLVLKYDECYFATGNHELECGKVDEIKRTLTDMGVKVLGENSYTSKYGILVGGTDFAFWGNEEEVLKQKKSFASKVSQSSLFSVLVRHVPMKADFDEKIDLILSGHNHGGLWRLPKTNLGVAGGGGRFFPKYPHGKYSLGNTDLIVSSGLTVVTLLLPRIYNPPEVVSISINPEVSK